MQQTRKPSDLWQSCSMSLISLIMSLIMWYIEKNHDISRLSVMQKKYQEFWQDFVVNVIKNVMNCTQMTSINNIFNDIDDQI